MRLLRRKEDHLLIEGRMSFDSEKPRRRRVRLPKQGILPDSDYSIVLPDGSRSEWLVGGGGFGEVVFVSELFDIDWVPTPGSSVTLNVEVGGDDQDDLLRILRELSNMDWATGSGRWSIQQARHNWHGVGVGSFAEAIIGWQSRYRGLGAIHHTEQVRYYDQCDGGFYALAADVSASSPRLLRHCDVGFELIGGPMNAGPIRRFCESLDIDGPFYWRPRVEKSVESRWMGRKGRVTLRPVVFIVERHDQWDPPEDEWVVGIAAAKPYCGEPGMNVANRPEWWPAAACESELLVCDLRSHHPLIEPRRRYYLQSCQWAWAWDVLVFRPLADW
jgi:hypothetical protein